MHAFTDGRDTAPDSGLGFLRELERAMAEIGVGRVGTVSGRYYAMDRDRRWERTRRAYEAIVHGIGERAGSAEEAVSRAYAAGITDEFIPPTVIDDGSGPGHDPSRRQRHLLQLPRRSRAAALRGARRRSVRGVGARPAHSWTSSGDHGPL